MRLFKKKQCGHAMILFVMIIPALFGIFTLASDGTRAMQTRARVADATEAASLAVAAQNSEDAAVNQELVRDYLNAYEHSIVSITNVQVTRLTCEQIPDCVAGLARGENRYFEYDVKATASFKTWFAGNDAIEGFGETFSAGGDSIAHKLESEGIDIMIAADFSGSMGSGWSGSNKAKYRDLIEIVQSVADELQGMNEQANLQNMIGMVPYNGNTYSEYQDSITGETLECWMYQNETYESGGRLYTDVDETLANIFVEKDDNNCGVDENGNRGKNTGYKKSAGSRQNPKFEDIRLTSDIQDFKSSIAGFRPGAVTGSYQGWIRSAQLMRSGVNERRLIILLSDGMDIDWLYQGWGLLTSQLLMHSLMLECAMP